VALLTGNTWVEKEPVKNTRRVGGRAGARNRSPEVGTPTCAACAGRTQGHPRLEHSQGTRAQATSTHPGARGTGHRRCQWRRLVHGCGPPFAGSALGNHKLCRGWGGESSVVSQEGTPHRAPSMALDAGATWARTADASGQHPVRPGRGQVAHSEAQGGGRVGGHLVPARHDGEQ
jgi:hypothetical protein